MNIRKEIIKILSRPINYRSFKMKSHKETKHTPPYFTLSNSSAGKLTKDIIAVCNKRNNEMINKLLKENIGEAINKFGFSKYPTTEKKLVIEGFSLARNYILRNKMKL